MSQSAFQKSQLNGLVSFILITATMFAVWGWLLPRFLQQPEIASRIVELEFKKIDPSAMFYTELEIAEEISYRVEKANREYPDSLWKLKKQ